MRTNVRILLAEDDENLGYILSEYLSMNQFDVTLCKTGLTALKTYQKTLFDICVLDVMMPEMDGFTLAKQIKEIDTHIPILFLTAKMLKVDKLKGFKLGADDYIVKPIDEEELIARIKAVLKRTQFSGNIKKKIDQYVIGSYTFNYKNQTLLINDHKQSLTVKETEILKALCDCQGNILNRKLILKELWGEQDYFTRKSMDVFIYKLRKYLSKDSNIQIKNIHGKGFVLETKKSH